MCVCVCLCVCVTGTRLRLMIRKRFPEWVKKSLLSHMRISTTAWNLNGDSAGCVAFRVEHDLRIAISHHNRFNPGKTTLPCHCSQRAAIPLLSKWAASGKNDQELLSPICLIFCITACWHSIIYYLWEKRQRALIPVPLRSISVRATSRVYFLWGFKRLYIILAGSWIIESHNLEQMYSLLGQPQAVWGNWALMKG